MAFQFFGKESAHAALSFIRSQADRLSLPADFYKEKDIHVHFPAGAVPKDRPLRAWRRETVASSGRFKALVST